MPFLTEELWQALRERAHLEGEALIMAPYPEAQPSRRDAEAEAALDLMTELVRGLRNLRGEFRIAPSQWLTVQVVAEGETRQAIEALRPAILALARGEGLSFLPPGTPKPEGALSVILPAAEAYVPLAGLVDLASEHRRIERDLAQARQETARSEAKLANTDFLSKAPAAVIEKEREKLAEQRERTARLEARLLEVG
jgi:valyl-tRNA synthetase